MAGLEGALPVSEQVALLARLRWRLFRNSLRPLRARVGFILVLLSALTVGMMDLGVGGLMGAGAFYGVRQGRVEWLGLMMWVVFVRWQVVPLFIAASTPQFEFSDLLRFPLRFSSFFALSLSYGLFDTNALAALLWLVAVATGAAVARPATLLSTLPLVAVFAAMNLALSRLVFAGLERWLARRRTREILAGLFFIGLLGLQLVGPALNHLARNLTSAGHDWPSTMARFGRVERALPPGLAGLAVVAIARRAPAKGALSTVLLAGYAIGFAWLLSLRLRAQYRGEDVRESQVRARSVAKGSLQAWRLPGMAAPAAAVFEKELRYVARNGPMLFSLVSAPIILILFSLPGSQPAGHSGFVMRRPELMFPLGVALSLLALINFSCNSLAYDGAGIQLLLGAPVRFQDVMLGKNLAHLFISAFETFLVWVVTVLIAGAPGVTVFLITLAALLFTLPVNLAAGNLLSLYFPVRVQFGAFRRKQVSGVSGLVNLGLQFLLVLVIAAIIVAAHLLGGFRLAIPILLALAALGMWGYRRTLELCSRLAVERREVLLSELCK